MQSLWQDLRYGARMLRKHPGFTLIAVVTLALGIGANATIFSLANAVLLRPLPIAEPERVMSVYSVAPDGARSGRFSWLDFADYRAQSDAFAGLSAQMQTLLMLGASEQAEPIFGEVADGNYFTLLGVQSVSLSNRAPLDISTPTTGAQIAGHFPPPGRDDIPLAFYRTTPGYFQTMRIPLLRGPDFTERDNESAPRVALINETMARRFFADADPMGKRFRLTSGEASNAMKMNAQSEVEIIGVVKDSKYRTLGEEPTPLVYLPFWQNYKEGMALLVRTAGAPEQMMRTVRGELLLFDKEAQGFFARTMHEHMAVVIAPSRIAATILSVSGVIALLLAALGLYGVISYAVSQRLPEMGIRLALGAQPRDILRLILGQGLRLALLGIGVGVLASWALTRFLANLLFGVGALNPLILVAVALLLALVSLLACWLPARRATKVDPMIALRTE